MPVPVEPRLLTSAEWAVIERILQVDFPGSAELRHQLDRARVVALWGPDSVSVDLQVIGDTPRAPLRGGVVPVYCTVRDENGEIVGEILLWNDSGVLSGLEYAWYCDQPPTSLPDVARMRTGTGLA